MWEAVFQLFRMGPSQPPHPPAQLPIESFGPDLNEASAKGYQPDGRLLRDAKYAIKMAFAGWGESGDGWRGNGSFRPTSITILIRPSRAGAKSPTAPAPLGPIGRIGFLRRRSNDGGRAADLWATSITTPKVVSSRGFFRHPTLVGSLGELAFYGGATSAGQKGIDIGPPRLRRRNAPCGHGFGRNATSAGGNGRPPAPPNTQPRPPPLTSITTPEVTCLE